jgi:hypothetical protein
MNNTPLKKLGETEQMQKIGNVPCYKLKEFLTRRNMSFEEKKTGRTTTIIIRRQQSQL